MSKISRKIVIGLTAGLVLPQFAYAALSSIEDVLDYLISAATPLLSILVGIAIIVFFWGIVKTIAHGGDEAARAEGKELMVWGMVGFVVMVSFWAILGFIQESFYASAGGSPTPISSLELQSQNIPAS